MTVWLASSLTIISTQYLHEFVKKFGSIFLCKDSNVQLHVAVGFISTLGVVLDYFKVSLDTLTPCLKPFEAWYETASENYEWKL